MRTSSKIKGGKEAVRLINSCLENGESFTQETTLSGQKTLKTILAAREKEYRIRLYYVAVSSAEESLLRIQNRVRKGGHDIPRDYVIRRFENCFEDLIKVLPYCDETVFFDNENGFVRVAEFKNVNISLTGKQPPIGHQSLMKFWRTANERRKIHRKSRLLRKVSPELSRSADRLSLRKREMRDSG